MKTLLFLRHAKSSWKQTDVADHDRPLNKRGKQDAPRMGILLRQQQLTPDVIVSSTAARARCTADAVADACAFDGVVQLEPQLYLAAPAEILDVCASGRRGGEASPAGRPQPRACRNARAVDREGRGVSNRRACPDPSSQSTGGRISDRPLGRGWSTCGGRKNSSRNDWGPAKLPRRALPLAAQTGARQRQPVDFWD